MNAGLEMCGAFDLPGEFWTDTEKDFTDCMTKRLALEL